MSKTDIIVISVVLILAALLVVSYINSRQTRARLIAQRLRQLKRRVEELEDLSVAIESLTGSARIAQVVIEDVIDTLRGMLQLDRESTTLPITLINAQQRLSHLQSGTALCQIYRIMESDAAIARAQFQLGEAGRIIRKRQAAGFLELPEMTSHIQDLAWSYMMVSVVTLTAQGHKAIRAGDFMRGFSYYKRAQQAAMVATVADDRRHQLIRELGEIQANRRRSLSLELMPETQFNPEEDSPNTAFPSAESQS